MHQLMAATLDTVTDEIHAIRSLSNIYDANTTSDSVLPIELKTINDHDRAAAEYDRVLTATWGKKTAENIIKRSNTERGQGSIR